MAATGLKVVTGLYADVKSARVMGTGAIEATDSLVTDIIKYPKGSHYFDLTNRIAYVRQAEAKAIGDWCKSSAYSSAAVIAFTAPTGATSWVRGTTQNITWTDNISENVNIELYKNSVKVSDIVLNTESDGTYAWAIPADLVAGADYTVKIVSVVDPLSYKVSAAFTITET